MGPVRGTSTTQHNRRRDGRATRSHDDQEWLDDFVQTVRSDRSFKTSAGAEPEREYAYLEWHDENDRHSLLLFKLEDDGTGMGVHTYRFDGDSESVRNAVDAVVHAE